MPRAWWPLGTHGQISRDSCLWNLLRYDLRLSSCYWFQMRCLKCDQQVSGDTIPFGIQKTPQLHPDVPEPREELLKDTARPL